MKECSDKKVASSTSHIIVDDMCTTSGRTGDEDRNVDDQGKQDDESVQTEAGQESREEKRKKKAGKRKKRRPADDRIQASIGTSSSGNGCVRSRLSSNRAKSRWKEAKMRQEAARKGEDLRTIEEHHLQAHPPANVDPVAPPTPQRSEEGEQTTVQENENFLTMNGAFAVGQGGRVIPRTRDNHDNVTVVTDTESVQSSNYTMSPSARNDNSDVVVEAELADTEAFTRLEEENDRLRQAAAQLEAAEVAHVLATEPPDNVESASDNTIDANDDENNGPFDLESTRKLRHRRLFLIMLGVVLVVVVATAAVSIAMFLSGNDDDRGDAQSPSSTPAQQSPTRGPSQHPSRSPTLRPTTSLLTRTPTTPVPLLPNVPFQPLGQVLYGKDVNDGFGFFHAMSRDGTVMAVTALQDQKAGYISIVRYNPSTEMWESVGEDLVGLVNDKSFGPSVSLNDDGTIVAIGGDVNFSQENNAGRVVVFEYNNTSRSWMKRGDDIYGERAEEEFGVSVSLSGTGDILAVGAMGDKTNGEDSGAVRLFQYDRESSSYTQRGNDIRGIASNAKFGLSVSLNLEGTIVAVGAPDHSGRGGGEGQVRIFQYNSSKFLWEPLGNPIEGLGSDDQFGWSVSLDDSGLVVAAGAPEGVPEYALVFEYDSEASRWRRRGQKLRTEQSGDDFGRSLSLSGNGNVVAIGSRFHDVANRFKVGRVTVYQYDSTPDVLQWSELGKSTYGEAAGDWFGYSVSISATGTVVGVTAYLLDTVDARNSGAAYAYSLPVN